MQKYTRGFAYWQLAILTLADGHPLRFTTKYKNVMKLFSDFNINHFSNSYEKLRIDGK